MMNFDLTKFGSSRIGVIGDFALDVYWEADMRKSELSRETPHFPLPVVSERMSPGAAGNVVMNMLALGPQCVRAIGVFGEDWRGNVLKGLLEKAGADVSSVLTDPEYVTNTFIKPLRRGFSDDVVYEDPRLDFVNYDSFPRASEDRLIAELRRVAGEIDVLCVCDQMQLNCGCVTDRVRAEILRLARKGLRVIVDSRDRIGLYRDAIVKPNEIEASRVFRGKIAPDAFEQLAVALERRTKRPAIVTAGERGCYVSEKGRVTHVKARRVTGEIDFCGAGDTFLSGLAVSLSAGFPLAAAAAIGCCASSVTIKKLKTTGTADRAELARALKDYARK